MKKIILTVASCFAAVACAFSQERTVVVNGESARLTGDGMVEISFTVRAGCKAVRGMQSLMLTPRISLASEEGIRDSQFTPVLIQGRRARISDQRESMSYGIPTRASQAVSLRRGETMRYRQTVPYEPWMEGAILHLDRALYTNRSLTVDTDVLIRDLALGGPQANEAPVCEEAVPVIPVGTSPGLSAGDTLSRRFGFVTAAPERGREKTAGGYGRLFDYDMPLAGVDGVPPAETEVFVGEDRSELLQLGFAPEARTLSRTYADNNRALVDLVSVVRAIEESGDSRVERIVVAGFSSPVGAGPLNLSLTAARVDDVRNFILNNTSVAPGKITVHSEGMDWTGLRRVVAASAMPSREAVLNIIDNVPVWDHARGYGRMGELMRLRGGDPYRYLYSNYFPRLCDAVYVKVYYRNLR